MLANRYEVLGLLGEGAMGQVYRVRDRDGSVVALKLLAPAAGAPQPLLQLEQEFRLMTRLRHPNCCAVYDYGVAPDGRAYFTMELVPGRGLDELGVLDEVTFRDVFAQVLRALAYVHQAGFVHRDVKGANVRVLDDGQLKLMDYGLMTWAGRSGQPIAGTPATLAPEVIKRGPVDGRADLYSAGCLAYELLAGRAPFVGAGAMAVLRAHVGEAPPPLDRLRPGLDPAIARLVARLLAKDPADRPQTAEAALAALGVPVPAGLGGALVAAPLVGREPELATLAAALAEVLAGRPGGTWVLHGPPGAGKSRLAGELRVLAQLQEALVAVAGGPAHPAPSADLPYAPFVAVFRTLLPTLQARVPAAAAGAASALARLLPELAAEAPEADDAAAVLARTHAALAGLLAELAAQAPLVLLLEDWQWADPLSRALLAAVSARAAAVPLAVVLTAREAPDRLGLPEGYVPVPVPPLAGEALARMVGAMLGGGALPAGLLALVEAQALGNPFHVERLLVYLARAGALAPAAGGWRLGPLAGTLPRNLDALLAASFAALPAPAAALARAASVLGRTGSLEVLAEVAALDAAALLDARDALARAGVGAVDEDGRFVFAADRFAEACYDGLAAAERVALHGAARQALASRQGPEPASWPLGALTEAATHALRAADPAAGVTLAIAAGRRLLKLYALADAERFLAAGLGLARGVGSRRYDELAALEALWRVRFLDRRMALADATAREALRLAEALDEPGRAADAAGALGQVAFFQEDVAGALAAYDDALARARALGDAGRTARALARRGRAYSFDGRYPEAIADLEAARGLVDAEADPGLAADVWSALGYFYVLRRPERAEEGLALTARAVAAFRALGDPWLLAHALARLGDATTTRGRLGEAREAFQEALELADAAGLATERLSGRVNRAWLALAEGDFRLAARLAAEGAAGAEPLDLAHHQAFCLGLGALAEAGLGRLANVPALAERALAAARQAGMAYTLVMVLGYRVEALARLGQGAAVEAAAAEALRLMPEGGYAEHEAGVRAWLADARLQAGDGEGARAEAEAAARLAAHCGAALACVLADRSLARVALAQGNWDEARARSQAAWDRAEATGLRPLAAELRGLLGEGALAVGNAALAAAQFEAMHAEATALGAPLLVALARFGRAAARPYAATAAADVAAAREALEAAAGGLGPEARAAWLAVPEVRRAWEGNAVAFGLPRAQARPGRAPGLGLRPDWGG